MVHVHRNSLNPCLVTDCEISWLDKRSWRKDPPSVRNYRRARCFASFSKLEFMQLGDLSRLNCHKCR